MVTANFQKCHLLTVDPSGHWLARIASSSSTGGMDVCLLWVSFVRFQVEVSATNLSLVQRSPYRVWGVWVWSKNLVNEEALVRFGPQRHMEKEDQIL